ncbi:MAG: DUF362 domain-containing protein [Chloroflexi bacterium]|nr:DUF362 domain-containing protein [Chloroflexota bacterium]
MTDVAVVRCPEYTPSAVYDAVRNAVAYFGGMGAFVKAGQTVLLKPNLLKPSAPDEAVTTHPHVVGAVARLVRDCGAKAVIADSPGGPLSRSRLRRVYDKGGLTGVAADTQAVLNFDLSTVQVSNPNGTLIKRFELIQPAIQADVVINLPKLKTHTFMHLTGATKNVFGLVPGVIKAGYHAKLTAADDFARMLLDLLSLVKPSLTVVDAIVGMDGDGPAAGKPRHIGALIVSTDAVAADAAAASIAGFQPGDIPTLRLALERGLPGAAVSGLNILGEPLEKLKRKDFRPPRTTGGPGWLPAHVLRYLSNSLVVPTEVSKQDCNGCADCFRMCPVEAISMKDKKASIDKNLCIRCYCCHEICPARAIELKASLLHRMLMRH